jgi:predicted nucleotidyltransferase
VSELLFRLERKNLIHPPRWLASNTHYIVIMGSEAYACSTDISDKDIYGFAIPPKEDVFPHLRGEVIGFGKQHNRFENWQEHHVEDEESRRNYDFSIFSIVKYFDLCMQNNPNMLDSLFVPQRCILHATRVAQLIRESRKTFLHKGCWHKFKGYAYSQLHKMSTKSPDAGSRRVGLIEKYGFDVKFAAHVVRLMLEVEQVLAEQDLDLERNGDLLRAIRRGEWTQEKIKEFFGQKEKELETLYNTSTLPYKPDEAKIKDLLLRVLEQHYGSLDKAINIPGREAAVLSEIRQILDRVGY